MIQGNFSKAIKTAFPTLALCISNTYTDKHASENSRCWWYDIVLEWVFVRGFICGNVHISMWNKHEATHLFMSDNTDNIYTPKKLQTFHSYWWFHCVYFNFVFIGDVRFRCVRFWPQSTEWSCVSKLNYIHINVYDFVFASGIIVCVMVFGVYLERAVIRISDLHNTTK